MGAGEGWLWGRGHSSPASPFPCLSCSWLPWADPPGSQRPASPADSKAERAGMNPKVPGRVLRTVGDTQMNSRLCPQDAHHPVEEVGAN